MGEAELALEGMFFCQLCLLTGAMSTVFVFPFIGLVLGVELYLILLNFLSGLLLLSIVVRADNALSKNIPSLLLPFLTLLTLDLFVGIFSICSLFVRTPPWLGFMEHLNWRDHPRVFYMYFIFDYRKPSEPLEGRAEISVTLVLAAVLLVKSYFVKCAWGYYMSLKAGRREERQVHISTFKVPEKGLLPPSNEEAEALQAKEPQALPAKEPPPPAGSG